jgi:hypothetical protein
MTSALPGGSLADGYFSGGNYPDLVTTDPGATDASLWLFPGTGNGTLGAGIDIGGEGNTLNPGTDGPADWNGAEIVHGDLTGSKLQDILAYYPQAAGKPNPGTGVIIAGTGNTGPLDPWATTPPDINAGPGTLQLCDDTLDGCASVPADLVYAGNASQESTGTGDLIGSYGSGTAAELDLFTANEPGAYYLDNQHGVLSTTSPDGTADWQDYALATAQLPDTAHPSGDAGNTALFALDDKTGRLYVSVNPGCANGTCSAATLTGMPGTWAQVSGTPSTWTTMPPQLASADVNNGGNGPGTGSPEVWTITRDIATAYAITGITSTAPAANLEGSGTALDYPGNSWALNDGAANPSVSPVTATDSVTGSADPITGVGYAWAYDESFDDVLAASTGAISPGTGPVPNGSLRPAVSIWFKTTASNQVLVSTGYTQITASSTAGSSTTAGENPVLYIGADGRLLAEWWDSHVNPLESANPVNDGLWHHATLASDGTSQTLTLDGASQTQTGTVDISADYFYIGAGYFGNGWPDENYYNETGKTSLTFFNGDIADATVTDPLIVGTSAARFR